MPLTHRLSTTERDRGTAGLSRTVLQDRFDRLLTLIAEKRNTLKIQPRSPLSRLLRIIQITGRSNARVLVYGREALNTPAAKIYLESGGNVCVRRGKKAKHSNPRMLLGTQDTRMPIARFRREYRMSKEELVEAVDALEDYRLLFAVIGGAPNPIENIASIQNATLRAEAIAHYGDKRFFMDADAKTIHRDGPNELMRLSIGRLTMTMLHVKDSTTGKYYLLRVPNEMKRVRQAVAWTFGLNEEQYNPEVET